MSITRTDYFTLMRTLLPDPRKGRCRRPWFRWLLAAIVSVQSAQAGNPQLQIVLNGTNVVLHWPVATSNFVVESSRSLTPSNTWTTITSPGFVSGSEFVSTNAVMTVAQFFRLRQKYDFYGRPVGFVKLFGQKKWGDTSPGLVTGAKIFHAPGVLVDRSAPTNHIYVADSGNNRFLGFFSYDSPQADLIFGQPDASSGAANGDSNLGFFGATSETNLCLEAFPMASNVAEQWMRINFDVDAAGNLYVPDFYNNRVLVYFSPFSGDKSGGKGDTVADFVIGQDDFASNGINRGQGPDVRDDRSLYLSYPGFATVSARSVSVDAQTNVWVADTFNYRVLRFAPGSKMANLVLGQSSFTNSEPACQLADDPTNAPLDRMCSPTLARVNPDTGELFVVDEYPGGFPARILVFTPPFSNGMAAARQIVPRQPLQGDYAGGYRFTHATGLVFNPFKTDDLIDPGYSTNRYRDGVFWVHAADNRTLLLDGDGNILQAIGAPDIYSRGLINGNCGMAPEAPFYLVWAGGMIGFDSANNIYLADESWHRIARFSLPYRVTHNGPDICLPTWNGGMFAGTDPNSTGPASFAQDQLGVLAFQDQLIVRDQRRYMIWTNYLEKSDGAGADFFIGQNNGYSITNQNLILGGAKHAVDDHNRLWTHSEHEKLLLFQLPFTNGATALRELIPLYWADEPDVEVDYICTQPVAFDPINRKLWLFDGSHARLLRVGNPDDWQGKLLVDAIIGQTNKTDSAINRGMNAPDAASFGAVNDIKFDRLGNLFVVDNTYECGPNGRVIAFLASDLAGITDLFPAIQAKQVYCAETFDQTDICRIDDPVYGNSPFSPVSVAFNSRNEMVIGNDGYNRDPQKRAIRQLYLYRTPLTKNTPDAFIELPLGAPGEITFDARDNLIVQDATWNKVWIINYDLDPSWLRPWPLTP